PSELTRAGMTDRLQGKLVVNKVITGQPKCLLDAAVANLADEDELARLEVDVAQRRGYHGGRSEGEVHPHLRERCEHRELLGDDSVAHDRRAHGGVLSRLRRHLLPSADGVYEAVPVGLSGGPHL